MSNFDQICESLTQIKTTKILRYPKQIKLSEEFVKALKKEVESNLVIDESKEVPIRNFNEKFAKALNFHIKEISEHCGKCHKKRKRRMPSKKRIRKQGPAVEGITKAGTEFGTSIATGAL